jgi:glycosyltransferase involved in cell wall biosynthesis
MRLLIITQSLDENNPVLGFFVRWVQEFAKNCESVTVICLEKGKYSLPENVRVLSLGKESRLPGAMIYHSTRQKLGYVVRLYKFIWRERKNYDSVFVHMNQIYVILGGLMWKLMKKKVGLWYTHKQVSFSLRVAEKITDIIFTASKESFRLQSKKVNIMGHGIDTDFFSPYDNKQREDWWLSVGRLMPSKRHDRAIEDATQANKALWIVGDGPERQNLERIKGNLKAEVKFLGSLTQLELRDLYRRAELLVHRSETGSLDKVVLEAASCGLKVDSTDPAISKLPLSSQYVKAHHSLPSLITSISKYLTK